MLGRRERGEVVVIVGGRRARACVVHCSPAAPRSASSLLAVLLLGQRRRGVRARARPDAVPLAAGRPALPGAAPRRVGGTYRSDAREAGVRRRHRRRGRRPAAAAGRTGDAGWRSRTAAPSWRSSPSRTTASLTSVLEIEGPGVGLFDGPDQEGIVARWGAVLRDLANSEGFVSRIGLLERCVPADPEAHAALRRGVRLGPGAAAARRLLRRAARARSAPSASSTATTSSSG